MIDIDHVLKSLARSRFRSKFTLRSKEIEYIAEKGMDVVMLHASDFIDARLAPAFPRNDGKQTPFGGHPVFIAQHATGTCCRSCLEKWHGVKKGRELNDTQKKYVLSIIRRWIGSQVCGDGL